MPRAILGPSGFQHDDRTIHPEPQADPGDSARTGVRFSSLGDGVSVDGAGDRGIRPRPLLVDEGCPLAVVTHPGHQVFQAASDWRTSATG